MQINNILIIIDDIFASNKKNNKYNNKKLQISYLCTIYQIQYIINQSQF